MVGNGNDTQDSYVGLDRLPDSLDSEWPVPRRPSTGEFVGGGCTEPTKAPVGLMATTSRVVPKAGVC